MSVIFGSRAWLGAIGHIVTAIAVLGLVTTPAHAMRVSPMVLELSPTGSGASGRIEVQNTTNANLAFETRVTRITFSEDGVATEVPADEDFLIVPPQGVLPPGGRQVVRVQWVGTQPLTASQSYYVSVNQLPVAIDRPDGSSGAGQLQIVYHMKALVVVAPRDAQPNVSAVAARATTIQVAATGDQPAQQRPGVEVTLRNTGARHAFMSGVTWRLDGRDTNGRPLRVDIPSAELGSLIGTGYVGPNGGQRLFRVPVPQAFGPESINVTFVQ